MTIAERRTERDASGPSDTSAHDRTLLTAIETLAGVPGLADRLHDALAGECTLLFSAQIGARLTRAGISASDADRVHRVMEDLQPQRRGGHSRDSACNRPPTSRRSRCHSWRDEITKSCTWRW